jgi:hypothetical protein
MCPEGGPQVRTAKNTIFLELLGNGGLYSVNYDRWVHDMVSVRVGASFISLGASSSSSSANISLFTMPIMGNFLIGSDSHKFEAGLGALLVYASASATSGATSVFANGFGVAGTGTVGYRYSDPKGGFVFRIGVTPLFGAGGFRFWGGLSFGYGF